MWSSSPRLAARSNPGAPDRRVRTMAWECLSLVCRASGAKPLVPFGKGNRSSQEGGNTGRRTMRSCRPLAGTAVCSAPGRDRAESAVYSGISRQGKGWSAKIRPARIVGRRIRTMYRDIVRVELARLDWPQLTSKKYLPCIGARSSDRRPYLMFRVLTCPATEHDWRLVVVVGIV